MITPIKQHSTMSVKANANRHRGASSSLRPASASRKSVMWPSLFMLSPFRLLSIDICFILCFVRTCPPICGVPVASPETPLRYALLVTTKSLRRTGESGESHRNRASQGAHALPRLPIYRSSRLSCSCHPFPYAPGVYTPPRVDTQDWQSCPVRTIIPELPHSTALSTASCGSAR